MDSNVRHYRAKVAGLTRDRLPDDPELTDARRGLAEAGLAEHIRKVVDGFPPLTAEQRDRLAAALRPTSAAHPNEAA